LPNCADQAFTSERQRRTCSLSAEKAAKHRVPQLKSTTFQTGGESLRKGNEINEAAVFGYDRALGWETVSRVTSHVTDK